MTNKVYLYGKNPLEEALLASSRNHLNLVEKIFVTRQVEADPKIMSLLQSTKVPYEIVTVNEIEHIVGKDAVHQGLCALLDNNLIYTNLDEVLKKKSESNKLFVLLNELQDPHNVGAIIRSAVAFGAYAILLPEHNQTHINGTVIKSSSGMNFSIPIVKIGNINATLSQLKEKGFWIYSLVGDGNTSLHTAAFDTDTLLIIGNEGEGIKQKTLEHSDFKLSIPISAACESLNASNAATVVMYEWAKQNHKI